MELKHIFQTYLFAIYQWSVHLPLENYFLASYKYIFLIRHYNKGKEYFPEKIYQDAPIINTGYDVIIY